MLKEEAAFYAGLVSAREAISRRLRVGQAVPAARHTHLLPPALSYQVTITHAMAAGQQTTATGVRRREREGVQTGNGD